MKLLIFTDLHGKKSDIRELKLKTKKHSPDLLICAGDMTDFGHKLKNIISEFKSFNLPLIIIPGNHESNEEINELSKKFKFIINIHRRSYQINNYVFFGFGEGGFSKESKELEKIIPKFKKAIKKDDKIIFVTHQPPYKTKLDKLPSSNAGSKSIRKFIEEVKPILAISGHLHENENKKDKIKKTLLINPGSKGKIVEI